MTTNTTNLISVSYGLGLDSTALLVRLHARGVRPDFIIFADTGGEKPETYEYLAVINAWLQRVGFPLVTVVKYAPVRAKYTTLEGKCLANQGAPSAKTGGGTCSSIFKADVINKWLQNNAQVKAHVAAGGRLTKMIGYDDSVADRKRSKKSDRLNRAKLVLIDERRACNKKALKSQWEVAHCDFAYPLQDEALERPVLATIIRAAGLLVPVKSACFFCPNSQPEEVVELRLAHPDLYERALRIEHVDATGKHARRRRAAGLPVHPGLSNHGVWMWSALADCNDPAQARAHLRSKGFRISAVRRHPADEAAVVAAPVAAIVPLQVPEAPVAELRVAEAPAATYGQARMPQVLSYGGGLNSWAMLLDAVRRGERIDHVVFCDVGDKARLDPAEWPDTYRHIDEVVKPFCAAHGIPFVHLDTELYPIRPRQGGSRSLYAWMAERNNIPTSGARICTTIAKIERFELWLSKHYRAQTVRVWIGFEKGEEYRAEKDPNAGSDRAVDKHGTQRVNRFPLIEAGLCRCGCLRLALDSGYPVPRKSACVFCPFGKGSEFKTLLTQLPEVFAEVEQLELRKPATSNGYHLTIKGWRKTAAGKRNALLPGHRPVRGVDYQAPSIRAWTLAEPATRPQEVCKGCGQTKVDVGVGCGYYDNNDQAQAAE